MRFSDSDNAMNDFWWFLNLSHNTETSILDDKFFQEVYRAQERELTEKIESRDSEIENLKNENHALEEKLIEIQDIRNTSQNSDDEFQSAIEALQSTLQEVTIYN